MWVGQTSRPKLIWQMWWEFSSSYGTEPWCNKGLNWARAQPGEVDSGNPRCWDQWFASLLPRAYRASSWANQSLGTMSSSHHHLLPWSPCLATSHRAIFWFLIYRHVRIIKAMVHHMSWMTFCKATLFKTFRLMETITII